MKASSSRAAKRLFSGSYGIAAACIAIFVVGLALPTGAASPGPIAFSTRIVQSGHSLTDPIPGVLVEMARSMGGQNVVVDRSTIPGSPMDWRWKHKAGPTEARERISDYEILVLTERVSLSNTMPWHKSEIEALRWFTHAWTSGNAGKGAATILYATWVDLSSGPGYINHHKDPEGHIPWRQRLDLELVRWEKIVSHVNAARPAGSPEMRMIPGPLIMAAVYDAIERKEAPGLHSISQLFSDDIHINDTGAYLIALAHYAVIYRRDPRELPDVIPRGVLRDPALAAWMQDLVWKVVTGYPGSGVAAR